MPDELEILDNSTSNASEDSSHEAILTPPAEPVPPPPQPVENAPTPSATPVTDIPENANNEANKTYKNAGVVDLVFLVDVTGSMGPCINALRDNINHFIDSYL